MDEKKIEIAAETEEVKENTATVEEPKEETTPSAEDIAAKRKSDESTLLILSIVSVALSYFIPVAGLIVSIITLMKYKKHIEAYGAIEERGTLIKVLVIIGVVLGAVNTVAVLITTIISAVGVGISGIIGIISQVMYG